MTPDEFDDAIRQYGLGMLEFGVQCEKTKWPGSEPAQEALKLAGERLLDLSAQYRKVCDELESLHQLAAERAI